MHCQLY